MEVRIKDGENVAKGTRGGKRAGTDVGGGLTAPVLDKTLVRRANAAGTFVDYGDATKREYEKNAKEIAGMELSTSDRKAAIKRLHDLTESQLVAEGKAIGPYTAGPARVDRKRTADNANAAAGKRQSVKSFMDGVRKESTANKKKKADAQLFTAMKDAISRGALSFSVNGETYTRKTKRSKSFTKER